MMVGDHFIDILWGGRRGTIETKERENSRRGGRGTIAWGKNGGKKGKKGVWREGYFCLLLYKTSVGSNSCGCKEQWLYSNP